MSGIRTLLHSTGSSAHHLAVAHHLPTIVQLLFLFTSHCLLAECFFVWHLLPGLQYWSSHFPPTHGLPHASHCPAPISVYQPWSPGWFVTSFTGVRCLPHTPCFPPDHGPLCATPSLSGFHLSVHIHFIPRLWYVAWAVLVGLPSPALLPCLVCCHQ